MRAAVTAARAHYTTKVNLLQAAALSCVCSEASVDLVKCSAQAGKLATHTMRCFVTLMLQTWQAICPVQLRFTYE